MPVTFSGGVWPGAQVDGTVEEPFLFAIECLTCQRRLVVRSEAAIGAILTCPKCGSMVHVEPPEGWVPPAKTTVPEGISVTPAVPRTVSSPPTPVAPGRPVRVLKATPLPASLNTAGTETRLHQPPPLPPQGVATQGPTGVATTPGHVVPPSAWPGALTWKWVLWAALPVAILGLAAGTWAILGPSSGSEDAEADPEAAPTVAPGDDLASPPPRETPRPRLDRRFLPARTRLVFSLRTSAMAGAPTAEKIISRAGPVWESSVGRVLKGFKLGLRNIRRLTWAATDLTAWPEQSLVLIELEQDQDAGILRGLGEPVAGLQVAGVPCRRLSNSGWTAPLAVLDSKTILTGRRELLEELAAGTQPSLESPAVDRLLKEGPPDAEFSLVLDLAAARRAGLQLPGAWLDGWPAGKDSWHAMWETPQAMGLWLRRADGFQTDLALRCAGESDSERVRAAFDRFVPAARAALDSAARTLTARARPGQGSSEDADPLGALLSQSRDALAAARWEATAGTVWFRVRLGQTVPPLAATALDGRWTADRNWLDALLKPDETKAPAPADQTAKAAATPSPKVTRPAPEDEPPEDDDPEESVAASPGPDASVPVKVDVRARLADRWPEVSFPALPLIDAVRLIGRMSTLRIALDLDALDEVGVGPRDQITVRFKDASTGEILSAIASAVSAPRGLEPAVVDDRVVLTLPQEERSRLRAVKYDVSDLLRGQASAGTDLAATIRTLVAPAGWQQAGGQGTVEVAGGSLVVQQTGPVHRQVQSFCQKLRLARGLPARDSDPGATGLQTRLDRAWTKLREPVTVNFSAPTPIEELLAELEGATGTTILVDWAAPAALRRVADPRGVLQVHERPLCEALVEVLQPLDLGYRIVGPDLFEVTTRKAVADRLELEFYTVKDLLAAGQSGEVLAGRVKGQVAPATWTGAAGKGVVLFDQPSKCLIVLQSQPVQAAVQIELRKMAGEKAAPAKPASPTATPSGG